MKRSALLAALLCLSACTAEVTPVQESPSSSLPAAESDPSSSSAHSSLPPAEVKPVFEQSYTHPTDKYTIWFPAGWTVKEKAASPLTFRKNAGTAFITPEGYESDTTLVSALVFVERTRLPCVQFVNPQDITLNGRAMQKGDSTIVGSKVYTRNTMYTLATSSACYSIMLNVRACNATDNCGDDHMNTFEPSELNRTFDEIVASFKPL